MWVVNILMGLFTFSLGFIIKKYKLTFLIAGYNTASEETKKQYNVEVLVQAVGHFMYLLGGIIFLGGLLSLLFSSEFMITLSWIFFSVVAIGGVFYLNLSSKLKKK